MAEKRKPAKKLAGKLAAPQKVPQPHGGALLTGGVPGHKGAGGRPPDEHREWCRELIADPASQQAVRTVITDDTHPAFAVMWRTLAERGYGKPAQAIDLTTRDLSKLSDEELAAIAAGKAA